MTTGPLPNPSARSVAISRVREDTALYIVLSAPKTAPIPMRAAMSVPRPVMSPEIAVDCSA